MVLSVVGVYLRSSALISGQKISFMNYSEQQQFFQRSRMWAAAFVVLLLAIAGACVTIAGTFTRSTAIAFVLTILATVVSMGYTPNYLHLTVNPQKRSRWQIKI